MNFINTVFLLLKKCGIAIKGTLRESLCICLFSVQPVLLRMGIRGISSLTIINHVCTELARRLHALRLFIYYIFMMSSVYAYVEGNHNLPSFQPSVVYKTVAYKRKSVYCCCVNEFKNSTSVLFTVLLDNPNVFSLFHTFQCMGQACGGVIPILKSGKYITYIQHVNQSKLTKIFVTLSCGENIRNLYSVASNYNLYSVESNCSCDGLI